MKSEQQELEIRTKVKDTVMLFLKTGLSNEELAYILSSTKDYEISASSVQRYLTKKDMIIDLFDEETFNLVKDLIKTNKEKALSKGGINSSLNNTQLKDDDGKFIGNIPIESNNGNLKK